MHLSFILPLLLVLSSCSVQDRNLKDRIDPADLKNIVDNNLKDNNVPALLAAVFDPDTVIIYGNGVRDVKSGNLIDIHDRFHLGSCTKAITSFTAARLVEKGLISWDTKILEVFPEWEETTRDFYKDKTLTDLLSHRAGIQPFSDGREFEKVPKEIADLVDDEALLPFCNWLLTQDAVTDPNRGYSYSNAGYLMAGALLEKVAGKSYRSLVQNEVFSLFDIDGGFGWPHLSGPDQPLGHINPADWGIQSEERRIPLPDSLDYSVDFLDPAGNIILDIADYSVYLREMLAGLMDKGSKLTPDNFHHLFYGRPEYAMGWSQVKFQGKEFLSHDGSAGTFYCRASLFGDRGFGLIIFANAADPDTKRAVDQVSKAIEKLFK